MGSNVRVDCAQYACPTLQEYVPKFVKLAQTILSGHPTATASSIVFYGEWFQDKNSNGGGVNAIPGWYPFGYSVRQSPIHYCTMTQDLYQMFLDHFLLPPKLLYSGGGTLKEAVQTHCTHHVGTTVRVFWGSLFHIGISNSFQRAMCLQEEDSYIRRTTKVDLGQCNGRWASTNGKKARAWVLPKEVRCWCCQVSRQGPVLALDKQGTLREPVVAELQLAFNSVFSKSVMSIEDIRSLDKQGKRAELKRLNAEVLEDIQEQYQAVDEEMPKKMKEAIGKYVASRV
jgi:hypothetical protein